MPGIQIEHAQTLIRECIEADMSGKLETLRPMLAQDLDVIQVQGLCVVCTPVGPTDYVREHVRNKCGTICKDIDQMRVCADPLTDKCLQITTRGLVQTHTRYFSGRDKLRKDPCNQSRLPSCSGSQFVDLYNLQVLY